MATVRKLFVRSVRGLWLAYRMRLLREQLGLTLQDLAPYLDVDLSKLARFERGELPFHSEVVAALLNAYGVHDEGVRDELLALARDSGCVNWWLLDPAPLPPSARAEDLAAARLVGQSGIAPPPSVQWLYTRASEVAVYAPATVPSLLRTRAYGLASELHSSDPNAAPHHVREWAQVQGQRQQLLIDAKVPVTAVIDEHALRRPIGGGAVLAAQLDHLTHLASQPGSRLAVRILPAALDFHPGNHGGFTVLWLGNAFPPVALVEHLGGHLLLEGPWAARYTAMFDRLTEHALTVPASRTAITDAAKELANQPATPAKH